MKKILVLISVIFITICLLVSCSQNNDTNPTPYNYRLHSVQIVSKVNGGRIKNENYSLFYDGINRLNKFVYSSDDTSVPNLDVKFVYIDSNSKIYKTYYKLNDTIVLREDSFLINSNKQIVEDWTPFTNNKFQYNGKLLVQLTSANNATTIYNAHEGDFYKSNSTISYDSSQTFIFNKTMYNRPGDYLQLRSFLVYGQNIYQNNHLIKEIDNSGYTSQIVYAIDAYSKITQTNAYIADSVGNNYTYTYNIAYEMY